MKNILLATILILVQFSCAQDSRTKAESSVMNYMKKSNKSYKPLEFGEFFDQTYPKEVQEKIKTKKKVKYSLVHTYTCDKGKISNMYFHLTDGYEVVGTLSDQQMTDLSMQIAGPKLDSIAKFLEDSLMRAMEKSPK